MNSDLKKIFLISLIVAGIMQSLLWIRIGGFVDHKLWIQRISNLVEDTSDGQWSIVMSDDDGGWRYSGHPGTSILSVSVLLHRVGVSVDASLLTAVIVINTLIIATCATVCYYIRPAKLWWAAVVIILSSHYLYYYATPTNAVSAALLTLLFVLALAIYEKGSTVSRTLPLIWGMVFGLSMSTRLFPAVFIGLPLLSFLEPVLGRKQTVRTFLIGVAVAILTIPPLWFAPIEMVKNMLYFSSSFYLYRGVFDYSLTFSDFVFHAPFALIGMGLFFVTILFNNRLHQARFSLALPTKFVLVVIVITVGAAGVFAAAKYHTMRYFFPFIFTWDIFLSLWLLHYLPQISLVSERLDRVKRLWASNVSYGGLALITIAYAVMLYYNIGIAGPQGII